jgi:hypothetical protein
VATGSGAKRGSDCIGRPTLSRHPCSTSDNGYPRFRPAPRGEPVATVRAEQSVSPSLRSPHAVADGRFSPFLIQVYAEIVKMEPEIGVHFESKVAG